ncbi:protein inturned-like [Watersipora subatra]|uniref:protein inturned-like n=1 Tax=Watersipora subatra TaxID=2589382 RepID=UPI00355C64F2
MEPGSNIDWSGSVGEKGDVFHLVYDDIKPDLTHRLLPVGSTYEVILTVDAMRGRSKSGNSECERSFGIVPSKFSKTSPAGISKGYVRVAALIPGTEAFRSRINLNDWLMCINDLEVTWDTLDSILSAITYPKQVRLTFQEMVADSKKVLLTRHQSNEANLVRPIPNPGETISPLGNEPEHHLTVMYMTLDSSEDSSSNNLLYCYPPETKESNKLVAVRGMFLTLSNVMSDISSHPAKISSVRCEGSLVNICYISSGRQLLILAAPAERVTPQQLLHIMNNCTRCLNYLFSSLHSALSEKDNIERVNLFFSMLSQLLLSSPSESTIHSYYIRSDVERSYDTLSLAPCCIQLPEEAKTNVDNVLSEFEAADFGDMSEDFYEMRRAYTIMGCCLFYKGYLVANHLPTPDMLDIATYASHYNILAISRLSPIGSSMVWQEVFPTRRNGTSENTQDPFYVEVEGRYFLLIVAHKHTVMGVLLESGGCAARAMGNPVADVFYINQARQTLQQLETFDFSLICEARLQTPRPPLNCIENLQPYGTKVIPAASTIAKGILAKAGTTAADFMKRAGANKPKSKQGSDPFTTSGFMASIEKGDADALSHDSGSSPPPTLGSEAFARSRNMSVASTGSADSSNSVSQLYSSMRMGRGSGRIIANTEQKEANSDLTLTSQTKQNSFVLSSGEENTLFNYMSFDSVLGVVLSPTVDEFLVYDSADHRCLVSMFYATCLNIKCLFQQSFDSNDLQATTIHEHGVMFSLPSSISNRSHRYWVIGRCFLQPSRHEFYVCHHELITENMVELAFKINTGVLL